MHSEENMVVAVIVTYNRKTELCKNLEMLYAQSVYLDRIIVVDNCSTDGTKEQLDIKGYLSRENFEYLKTKENIGGAGGFYTGTKAAYDLGADWVVLMDDDGRPADENTFEKLFKEVRKLEKENVADGKLFINTLVQQGEMLSFKIDNMYRVDEAIASGYNGLIINAANPFNGTLITRKLVEEIGFPNPDFFIKGDEVDYKQRAFDVGAFVATVADARYVHPRPDTEERVVLGKKVPFFVESPWKEYYAARNFTYMYRQKGWMKGILFELIFVKLLAICCMPCKKIATIKMLLRGVIDGWKGKLGPTVRP